VPDEPNPSTQDPFVRGLIRRKAAQIARRRGFTPSDRDDLEQELTLRLLQRWHSFDPGRSPAHAFIALVVRHAVANVLRHRHAACRDPGPVGSLQRLVPADEGDPPPTLADTVGAQAHEARSGRRPRSDEERSQLAADTAAVLDRLPADLGALAEALKTHSLAEVARAWGVARSTLQSPLQRLRQHWEQAGMRDYLPPGSSPRAATG
jgi:RNA polymerase sigma-70 factor (ECF subfamily)